MGYFRNSMGPVERCLCDDDIDLCNAHGDVLVESSTRTLVVQKMIQEFHNGTELNGSINPDGAVGAAVQAAILEVPVLAKNHRTTRRPKTQCYRAQSTQATKEIDSSKELNIDYFRNSMIEAAPTRAKVHDGPIVNKTTHEFSQGEQIQQPRRSARFRSTPLRCSWSWRQLGSVMTKLTQRSTAIHTRKGQEFADDRPGFPESAGSRLSHEGLAATSRDCWSSHVS